MNNDFLARLEAQCDFLDALSAEDEIFIPDDAFDIITTCEDAEVEAEINRLKKNQIPDPTEW